MPSHSQVRVLRQGELQEGRAALPLCVLPQDLLWRRPACERHRALGPLGPDGPDRQAPALRQQRCAEQRWLPTSAAVRTTFFLHLMFCCLAMLSELPESLPVLSCGAPPAARRYSCADGSRPGGRVAGAAASQSHRMTRPRLVGCRHAVGTRSAPAAHPSPNESVAMYRRGPWPKQPPRRCPQGRLARRELRGRLHRSVSRKTSGPPRQANGRVRRQRLSDVVRGLFPLLPLRCRRLGLS